MVDTNSIKDRLTASLTYLKNKYPVKSIGLFGSYVRGEQTETSDLDILVEFEKPVSFLKYMALENELSEITGIKVDLVMKSALKPKIGGYIMKEVQYL